MSTPRVMMRLAAVVVATLALVVGGCGRSPTGTGPASLRPNSVASPSTDGAQLPDRDLAAGGLIGQGALVTPLNIQTQIGKSHLAVIGAYADPARTVLFFRAPNSGFPMVLINDDFGFLNASSSGSSGIAGDYVFILDAGPRPGADGTAHLKVTVTGFQPVGPGGGSSVANWTFSLQLAVKTSTPLAAVPMQFRLGSWTFTLEVADATASVVRVQALIDGASPEDLNLRPGTAFPVMLLDASDKPLIQIEASASVTVPKQQLNPSTYKRTRINAAWSRPAAAGTLQLRFEGNGSVVKIPLNLPALNEKGALSLGPTQFPAADESLTLTGSLAANITIARPSRCGMGTVSGGTIFAFATYFQSGGGWYWLAFITDPSVKQYSGPGNYAASASLYAVGPNGPNNVLFEGTAQLTVTSDRRPATGSVSGMLTGLEVSGPQSEVTVSGNWTCSPGSNIGSP